MRKSTFGAVIMFIILVIPISNIVMGVIHNRQREKMLQRDSDLFAAIASANAVSVRSLLDEGTDPNARADPSEDLRLHQPYHTGFYLSPTPLIAAIFANAVSRSFSSDKSPASEIIGILLKHGANIETMAINGTPLMSAITCGDTNTAEILLARGARIGTLNPLNHQPTAWFLAENQHNIAMMDLLLEFHEDVNARNQEQRTALSVAAEQGDLPIVTHLLQKGADVNLSDQTESVESGGKHIILNMTPLRWAADRGHAQIVKVLLAYGANPNSPVYDRIPILEEVGYENGGNDLNKVKAIRKMLQDAGAVKP